MKYFTPNFYFKKLHHIHKKLHAKLKVLHQIRNILHKTLKFLHQIGSISHHTDGTSGLPHICPCFLQFFSQNRIKLC